jgi:hypothetical protein
MFAIFNGLLILFDYFLCVLMVFPALCLYDQWLQRGRGNCWISCHCCHRLEAEEGHIDGTNFEEEKPSLIRLILTKFYAALHFVRFGMLLVIVGAIVVSGIYAATLQLPESSDVRLLSNSNEYERNYQWRLNLLSTVLEKSGGSEGYVIWGVHPADTGNHNKPSKSRSCFPWNPS